MFNELNFSGIPDSSWLTLKVSLTTVAINNDGDGDYSSFARAYLLMSASNNPVSSIQ